MEVKDLDAWVEQLNNCQQLSEPQVKNLTDKVFPHLTTSSNEMFLRRL